MLQLDSELPALINSASSWRYFVWNIEALKLDYDCFIKIELTYCAGEIIQFAVEY